MSLSVVEFNDAGIRVSDATGVRLSSPGYALVMPNGIEFGELARQQSRLHPLNCFNQFWHRLNLDPFVDRMRMIKSAEEIKIMRESVRLTVRDS